MNKQIDEFPEPDFSKYVVKKPVFEPYVYKEFPKFLYHAKHEARIFKSQEELESAGDGWVDSPEKVVLKETKKRRSK